MTGLIDFNDVEAAALRLNGVANETPLLESPELNDLTGGRILLKAESLQLGGSFKFRGAYNLISRLTDEERARGIVAWSSGNHAQGVARAASMFGARATIVMPKDAPAIKTDRVKALGAEIVPYDRYSEDREEIGRAIAQQTGGVLAPSYDHPDIIAGQGTVGLEIVRQADERAPRLDAVLICCGGGGLASGSSLAIKALAPRTDVYVVEPENYDDTARSLMAGSILSVEKFLPTLCDAVATPHPGKLTFPILQKNVSGGLVVSEDAVRGAVAWAFKYLKLVLEPGGAIALAVVLAGVFPVRGRVVAVTLSGGNVDPTSYAELIAS
ncbi:MAG: threonine/serine dehydratase [Pseudomonadota bacterium]